MARVFITGSSDGLGLMAAQLLAGQGHGVTLHGRNDARAADARASLPSAEAVVVGDLSSIAGMRRVAEQVNALGRYDAVIHNAGVGYREPRVATADGLEHVFAINVLAPYLLTALITAPNRLVYLGSGMHRGGIPSLDDPQWVKRPWNGAQAYSDRRGHAVVASRQRRSGRDRQRTLFSPPTTASRESGGARIRNSGRTAHVLRRAHGCRDAGRDVTALDEVS